LSEMFAAHTPTARRAVVTGGGRGIGAAIARQLLSHSWDVTVLERDMSAAELDLADQHLEIVEGDASVRADLDRACENSPGRAPLVGFVANAGFNLPGASHLLERSSWDSILEINLSAVFEGFRAAFDQRSGELRLIALSSFAGLVGLPGRAAYSAAKAGIGGLTRSLAVEWGRKGVRVNAICPGFVETQSVRSAFAGGTLDAATILDGVPLARTAKAEEIATVAAFLLSDESSYVTGVMLPVDGGASIQGVAAE